MRTVLLTLLIGLTLLVACAPANAPDPPPETATATISPNDSPTTGQHESPQGEPSAVIYGRTDEGAFFHGAADAPVTLIDYSDFL